MVQASCEFLALGFHVKPQRCFAALPHQTFIGTPAHTCPTDRCSSSAPSFLNVERCCRRLLVRPHPHRPDDGPLITPGRQLVRLCPGGCRHRPPRQTNPEGWLAVCCPSSRRTRCGVDLIFSSSDFARIFGRFDRARQSRRFFNVVGGLVRLILGLRRKRLLVVLLCHLFLRRMPPSVAVLSQAFHETVKL